MRHTKPVIIIDIIALFVLSFSAIAVAGALLGDGLWARQAAALLGVTVMLALIWLSLQRRGERWSRLGLRWGRFGGRQALVAVAQALLLFVLATLAFVLTGGLMSRLLGTAGQGDFSGYAFLAGKPLLLFGVIVSSWITASFSEEVIYRGFLLRRLEELFGDGRRAAGLAVAGSALLFGLAHFAWGPVGVAQTTAMGLVLAVGFLWFRRNLWVPILAHAGMDTLLFVTVYQSL